MQVSELLKQTIEALPGEQFTQAWKCVEEIDAALNKAGPTALLAASYCRAIHEERHAQLVMMQQGRIAHLTDANNAVRADFFEARDKLTACNAEYQKTYKKLERAKAKLKKSKA